MEVAGDEKPRGLVRHLSVGSDERAQCRPLRGRDDVSRASYRAIGVKPYQPAATSRFDSLELEQERANLRRAHVLGGVLLRVPPHRGARRKLNLFGLPGR